jgi:hypothetical protein
MRTEYAILNLENDRLEPPRFRTFEDADAYIGDMDLRRNERWRLAIQEINADYPDGNEYSYSYLHGPIQMTKNPAERWSWIGAKWVIVQRLVSEWEAHKIEED